MEPSQIPAKEMMETIRHRYEQVFEGEDEISVVSMAPKGGSSSARDDSSSNAVSGEPENNTNEWEDYLIGTQVAALVKRETFNMYRSMKIKGINLRKAEPTEVDYLSHIGAVRAGTHSVTFIPVKEAMPFIEDIRGRNAPATSKTKGKSSKGKAEPPTTRSTRASRRKASTNKKGKTSGGGWIPHSRRSRKLGAQASDEEDMDLNGEEKKDKKSKQKGRKKRKLKHESPTSSSVAFASPSHMQQSPTPAASYSSSSSPSDFSSSSPFSSVPSSPLLSLSTTFTEPSSFLPSQKNHKKRSWTDGSALSSSSPSSSSPPSSPALPPRKHSPPDKIQFQHIPVPAAAKPPSRRKPPPWEVHRAVKKEKTLFPSFS
ncbi:hypothetical protein QOT17_024424 [Balamuthia mandrillaris]